MLIGIVDFETTGLDSSKDEIIEYGYVIYDTERQKILKMSSNLVQTDVPLSEEITKITGIEACDIDMFGVTPEEAIEDMKKHLSTCEALVAHNAPFDKGFADALMKEEKIDKVWIDTVTDIEWHPHVRVTSKRLDHLCADHGINPNDNAHRALFDCMMTLKLLNKYDINEVLANAKLEKFTIVCNCLPPFKDTKPKKDVDVIKTYGFRWIDQQWTRTMNEKELAKIKEDLKDIPSIKFSAIKV